MEFHQIWHKHPLWLPENILALSIEAHNADIVVITVTESIHITSPASPVCKAHMSLHTVRQLL